jgi:hypothetical protein
METSAFDALLRGARDLAGLSPLAAALGFEPTYEPLDPTTFATPLDDAARELAVVGRSGTLTALAVRLRTVPDDGGTRETLAGIARRLRAHNPALLWLLLSITESRERVIFAAGGFDGRLRSLEVERGRPRRTDVECLQEMAARPGEHGLRLLHRQLHALERSRVTRRFFLDFQARRAHVAAAWTGLPAGLRREREQLALLYLSRLMFLYFLQRRGCLAGRRRYMAELVEAYRLEKDVFGTRSPDAAGASDGAEAPAAADTTAGFYRRRIRPLFFGALNMRPEARSAEARALGPLPYMNGGLFDRHGLERRFPDLDLPDDAAFAVFDELLERYRFTTQEAADAADSPGDRSGGVDPEMLGRVFEGLMDSDRRGGTGSFYTPAPVVGRLVREALVTYVAGAGHLSRNDAEALVDGRSSALRVASSSPRRDDDGRSSIDAEAKFVNRDLQERLKQIHVLDPACGSGAFLLDALARLARLRRTVGDPRPDVDLRRELVGGALYGVDLLDDAALLCSLRLWLALTLETGRHEPTPPLPNLDRHIRQGDVLVDPLDLGFDFGRLAGGAARDRTVRRTLREIEPARRAYVVAGPEERPALQRTLGETERRLARAWIGALDARMNSALREARAVAASRDLFGERTPDAVRADALTRQLTDRAAQLDDVRRALDDQDALPFFSFGVHFAHVSARGFDLVLSNPPWVRARRWPSTLRAGAAHRFEVCRSPGWRLGAELAGAPPASGAQVDLSLLFLERGLRMLAPGGVLAMVLPAKALRALFGAGARRLLLRDVDIVALEDHALDQHSMFRADAFAATIVARKPDALGSPAADTGAAAPGQATTKQTAPQVPTPAPASSARAAAASANGARVVRVTMVRRGVQPLRFALPGDTLPVVPGDLDAPWLLAPPDARAAFRAMQACGPPLARAGLRVRRGVFTGTNQVLLFPHTTAGLSGLVHARALGHLRTGDARFETLLDGDDLRPVVRGAGIHAWRHENDGHVLWCHDDATGEPREPGRHAARYLERHRAELEARSGYRPGRPPGMLFRVRADTLGPKVAWHDLADTLKAVALPATVSGADARPRPLVPLNTVYFLPCRSRDDALLLAALLNSLPVRTFARAIAERAKDARFRFFAWTVGLIPLPEKWRAAAAEFLGISRTAHERRAIRPEEQEELDGRVAALYGLSRRHLHALQDFDRWLRGKEKP